ncbi:MAG: hypothetical protein ACRD4Y_13985, partial [Candidatus Acidiferrales bacterium]
MKMNRMLLLLAAFLPCGGAWYTQPLGAQSAPSPAAQDSASTASPKTLIVPEGTRLPLILHNAVTTRNARPGDPVYLETLFPIVIHDRILIPAGSYVQGQITEA